VAARDETANGQLPLALAPDQGEETALPARLALPRATDGRAPFDDEAYFFEPWWPGAPATLRRVGDQLLIESAHLAEPLQAFPELADVRRRLRADGLIIEGTLLALDAEGRPDVHLLRERLRGAGAGVAAEGAFVASDLLYLEGHSLARLPFIERRRRLAATLDDARHCVLGRGLKGEGRTLGRAVASMGLEAISARRLDAGWKSGPAGDAWLRLPVVRPALPTAVPFLVLLERLPFDG
jgi:ATP-dependent DNA ligase